MKTIKFNTQFYIKFFKFLWTGQTQPPKHSALVVIGLRAARQLQRSSGFAGVTGWLRSRGRVSACGGDWRSGFLGLLSLLFWDWLWGFLPALVLSLQGRQAKAWFSHNAR